jgi:hypothetical protein
LPSTPPISVLTVKGRSVPESFAPTSVRNSFVMTETAVPTSRSGVLSRVPPRVFVAVYPTSRELSTVNAERVTGVSADGTQTPQSPMGRGLSVRSARERKDREGTQR